MQVPAKPGVFLLQDEQRCVLALASTANLRRLITSRLAVPDEASGPSRRVNYRAVTRTILATTVGSAFEADWAYLQLARIHLPKTYQSVLDRWQAWFIHVDPEAKFPQFVKTPHPGRLPAGDTGVNFGPFPEKHAAGRYIELLQDVFDLCRYHHILVQAPHGAACAYKEMGRCPAPCDGTVSLDSYHDQIRRAMEFAGMPIGRWRKNIEELMQQAAASQELESARRWRDQLDRSSPAAKSPYLRVDRQDRFCFVAIGRGELKGWARLMLIRGGWIEPVCDLRGDSSKGEMAGVLDMLRHRAKPHAADWCEAGVENLGLVCWHLFRQRTKNPSFEMLRLNDDLGVADFARSLRRVVRDEVQPDEQGESIDEHEMETGMSQA